jgi:hypothetical protein
VGPSLGFPIPPFPPENLFFITFKLHLCRTATMPPNNEATVEVNKEELRRAGDLVCSFYISFMATSFSFLYFLSLFCVLFSCALRRATRRTYTLPFCLHQSYTVSFWSFTDIL